MTFDQTKQYIENLDGPVGTRYGIYRVRIQTKTRKYDFHHLKVTGTFNKDNTGFSLNHYGWLNLPKQRFKKSKFHDEEDVDVCIWRDEFVNADLVKDTLVINMKTFNVFVETMEPYTEL